MSALQSRNGVGLNPEDISGILKEYNNAAKKRRLPPVHPVKQDRLEAGRPVWAQGTFVGRMFSGAREMVAKAMERIARALSGGNG